MANEPDWLDVVRDLLVAGWTAANTDSITPSFVVPSETGQRHDLAGNQDLVKFYYAGHVTEPNSVGSQTEKINARISIDISTFVSRSHKLKVYNEIRRVLATGIINVTNPESTYQYIIPLGIQKDEDLANFYRRVYDIRMVHYNWAR